MGVWIETHLSNIFKSYTIVTPLVGVWIETRYAITPLQRYIVTPLVGVWIETIYMYLITFVCTSLPSWECGLKLCEIRPCLRRAVVTPLVGVWIETFINLCN